MPRELPHQFLLEQNERLMRNYKVYEHFRADAHRPMITLKFYSKYDTEAPLKDTDETKLEKYEKLVERTRRAGPRARNPYPETENQVYGWESERGCFRELDGEDLRVLHHPLLRTDLTEIGLRIMQDKVTERPPWTGKPFITRVA